MSASSELINKLKGKNGAVLETCGGEKWILYGNIKRKQVYCNQIRNQVVINGRMGIRFYPLWSNQAPRTLVRIVLGGRVHELQKPAEVERLIYQKLRSCQRILENLGCPTDPERDAKRSVAMRPYFCTIRDEIRLETKAFIKIRRAALKRLIESDYNRYVKELRKYDSAITRTQP